MARKEHSEFSSNIDLIDVLPPGLYEAVFESNSGDAANSDLASGAWIMRCEARTLDDIRALGGNDADDERRFATAARVSEINLAMYRTFAQPFVRALVTPQAAEFMQRMHPLRMQYELFSNANPFMAWVQPAADASREKRSTVAKDNPLLQMQEHASRQIVAALDAWRDMSERVSESVFLSIYGSPLLQAAVGIDPKNGARKRAGKDPLHDQLVRERIAELKSRIPEGGIREATIRSALYVAMTRGAADERAFEAIRRIRRSEKDLNPLPIADFKSLVREQYFMLLIDAAAAIAAIPSMLPPDSGMRTRAFELIEQVVEAAGALPSEGQERLRHIKALFSGNGEPKPAPVINMKGEWPPSRPGRSSAVQSGSTKK